MWGWRLRKEIWESGNREALLFNQQMTSVWAVSAWPLLVSLEPQPVQHFSLEVPTQELAHRGCCLCSLDRNCFSPKPVGVNLLKAA